MEAGLEDHLKKDLAVLLGSKFQYDEAGSMSFDEVLKVIQGDKRLSQYKLGTLALCVTSTLEEVFSFKKKRKKNFPLVLLTEEKDLGKLRTALKGFLYNHLVIG